ncbi:hypothetical protein LCGC14_0594680 [marine sediment metagenome]|uniref:Histidine kinase N-terminal 7TM region domain-containing protein n=1 Tax=marine sediment metagenome TaxID=412755 RepID=A0A0F9RW65_9ZZZZ|nr:hypothetical protein [archaeon]
MNYKINIIPLFTSIISFVFAALLLRQFIQRRKLHQLMWTIALLFYGISALMELLMNPDILDFNVSLFSVFYITATSLVGFLGAGQLYLVVKHKVSHIFLAFVLIFSLVLLVGTILKVEDFPDLLSLSLTGDLGEDIRVISKDYLSSVYIYVVILASVGGTVLLVGSLYSFVRDRTRYYALFFTFGAIFPFLRNIPFGYLGNELAAVILFFIGFILSILYMNKQNV